MKANLLLLMAIAGSVAILSPHSFAQGFDTGSDGSMGALNVTSDTNLVMPTDGIFKFRHITVNAGTALRFTRNALNTPVYLLATGDVIINGVIDVSGGPAVADGGLGGPGGFNGGRAGRAGTAGSDGYGPGAGRHGIDDGSG